VKSLGTQDREEERFADRADQLRVANVRVGRVRAVFDPVIELLPSVGTLAVLLVGAHRAAAGAIGTGDIVFAGYLLTVMSVPVRAFGWVLGELPRALVGYDRIARVLDARGDQAVGDEPLPATSSGVHVRLTDVRVTVPAPEGEQDLLSGVDLDLPPGRTVALVGATGAGKSTLASLLPRLRDPSDGVVLLDGADLRALRTADVAAQVAYVAQQTFIFEDTVRANVTLADGDDAPPDEEVWAALATARLDHVVGRLPGGLDAMLGERGANLSGGQRQRLAIARALVRRPRLLVLDDATSAVDPKVERQILGGMRTLWGPGTGPTVLLVAYRMSSVLLADSVVHLNGGRVVDRGTHAELMERDDGYRELATAYLQESARRRAGAADAVGETVDGADVEDETDDADEDLDDDFGAGLSAGRRDGGPR
jgi:ABC-type multidrug transport system fused ATPase/permease subunit